MIPVFDPVKKEDIFLETELQSETNTFKISEKEIKDKYNPDFKNIYFKSTQNAKFEL